MFPRLNAVHCTVAFASDKVDFRRCPGGLENDGENYVSDSEMIYAKIS
jgi:hypothetical protein